MDPARIAELLQPFLAASAALQGLSFRAKPEDSHCEPSGVVEEPAVLSPAQLRSISTYIDLLLHWNSRINLTSVRDPEQIVTRHFGESLFAARALFPSRVDAGDPSTSLRTGSPAHIIDIGSGAGFPGLPIKLWAPGIHLTLIESNNRKATFLREVIRATKLTNVEVFAGRAEDFSAPQPGDSRTVTLRAVERFNRILPVAARLVPPSGRLALLIGEAQVRQTYELIPSFLWSRPARIPRSSTRFLLVGTNQERHVSQI